MKVYVDELPKLCAYCPYYYGNSQGAVCKLTGIMTKWNETLGEMQDKCPLQLLAEHDKQVRKEVIDKVYEVIEQAIPHDLCWSWAVIKKELNQIQGENNGNTNNN